jgi:hypothetical protein
MHGEQMATRLRVKSASQMLAVLGAAAPKANVPPKVPAVPALAIYAMLAWLAANTCAHHCNAAALAIYAYVVYLAANTSADGAQIATLRRSNLRNSESAEESSTCEPQCAPQHRPS